MHMDDQNSKENKISLNSTRHQKHITTHEGYFSQMLAWGFVNGTRVGGQSSKRQICMISEFTQNKTLAQRL